MKKKIFFGFTIFISLILVLVFLFTYYMNYFNSVAVSSTLEEYGDTYYLVESSDGVEVPVPYGYTASEIEGETAVETGFVIYEGDIDWSEIFDDDDTETSSVTSIQAQKAVATSSLEETQDKNTESNITVTYEYPEDYLSCTVTLTSSYEITLIEVKEADEYIEDTSFEIDEESLTCTKTFDENITQTFKITYLNDDEELQEEIEINITDILVAETEEEEVTDEEEQTDEEQISIASEEDIAVVDDETDDDDDEEESTYYLSEYGYSEAESEAIWDLQCSTNQYVWVYVSEDDLSTIYGVDSNGKYWGKLYTAYSTATNWTETDNVMSITSSTSYKEPDLLSSLNTYDTEMLFSRYLNWKSKYNFGEEMETLYYNTIKSIETYGGFYIGRYETGNLSSTSAVVQKNNSSIGSVTWYAMYELCQGLSNGNDNVTTSMIWGSLWDYTLRWLLGTGATTEDGTELTTSMIYSSSTAWGNYTNSTFYYYTAYNTTSTKAASTSTKLNSGVAEYTKVSNIYDLAGNVYDWTLEAYSTYGRVLRGGYYGSTSYAYASNRYGNYPTNSSTHYGCRSLLLIN